MPEELYRRNFQKLKAGILEKSVGRDRYIKFFFNYLINQGVNTTKM